MEDRRFVSASHSSSQSAVVDTLQQAALSVRCEFPCAPACSTSQDRVTTLLMLHCAGELTYIDYHDGKAGGVAGLGSLPFTLYFAHTRPCCLLSTSLPRICLNADPACDQARATGLCWTRATTAASSSLWARARSRPRRTRTAKTWSPDST